MTSRWPAACFVALAAACASGAQEKSPEERNELEWPRVYENGGDRVTVYDPQVDSWDRFETLKARSAVAVRPAKADREGYGVFEYAVETETDTEARQVLLKNRTITAVRFSGADKETAKKHEAVLRRV